MRFFLFSLSFFLFSPFSWTFAQETEESSDSHKNIFVDACFTISDKDFEKKIKNDFRCGQERGAEIISADLMNEEEKTFQKEVLDKLYQDNKSNANFIAEKGILETRRHKKCLENICQKIFEYCHDPSFFPTVSTENSSWQGLQSCEAKKEALFQISLTKLEHFADHNQARKDRELMKQKFNAISSRHNAYFEHWMTRTVGGFRDFVDKVFWFLMNPF